MTANPHTPLRSLLRLLSAPFALALTFLILCGTAGSASAADGYRYWNYFHLQDGAWAYAQEAASAFKVDDGAMEGYRYGASASTSGLAPRADLSKITFETVCAGTDADQGQKRVAVVIDYGTDADGDNPPAPRADCAVISADGTGQDALAAVADVRIEGGLSCALDGYPAKGCGEPVSGLPKSPAPEPAVAFDLPAAASPSAAPSVADASSDGSTAAEADSSESGPPWSLIGIIGVVVVIGAGGLVLGRRNRTV